MAKKDKIMDRLNALQPNVPTKTRARASKEKPAHTASEDQHPDPSPHETKASPAPVAQVAQVAQVDREEPAPVKTELAIAEPAIAAPVTAQPVIADKEEPLVPAPSQPIEHSLVVRENLPGYLVLMVDSFSEMEKLRGAMLKEIGNIHSLVFDAWTRSLIISYDIARTNFEYIMNLAMQSFTGGKDKP